MNNKQFQDWIEKSGYAKTENLIHIIFDNSFKKIDRITTRQLLQEAFEAGKKEVKK